jgi:plasmid stability protein
MMMDDFAKLLGFLHLDEEEIIAAVQGARPAHLADCDLCASRVQLAGELAGIGAIDSAERSLERSERLRQMLEAAVAAESAPARLRLAFEPDGGVSVRGHDIEIRYRNRAAATLRRSQPAPTNQPVTFRRRFGNVEVQLHLHRPAPDMDDRFNLIVMVSGYQTSKPSAFLTQNGRELAVQPLRAGRTTFKDLSPGGYVLNIQDRHIAIGRIHLDVDEEQP